MRIRQMALLTGVILGLVPGGVEASPLRFSFIGEAPSTGTTTLEFEIDSNPAPDFVYQDLSFDIKNVAYKATSSIYGPQTSYGNFVFGVQSIKGGFAVADTAPNSAFTALYGQQLFTGSVKLPMFKIGVYSLSGGVLDGNGNIISGTDLDGRLSISAVPLPSSAPMFGAALLGLAGVGYAARHKKGATAA